MSVEEFVKTYSSEYTSVFYKKETKNIPLSERISNFLFEPRYKVDNLKFESLG